MKHLILTLSLILGLATSVSANASIFRGEFEAYPSYSECKKAIEKGVEIGARDNDYRVFFYDDKLYGIRARNNFFRCTVTEDLD